MALINHGDEESEIIAVEILKNFSSIQNEDGSWYYFYDISGDIGKVSGKDYKESDTGYNALALQCSNDDDIGSAFLGSEEYVFKMVK